MAKKKHVRAVWIYTEAKSLIEIYTKPELSRYYVWLGCTCIESVVRDVRSEEVNTHKIPRIRLYVDEMGAYTNKPTFLLRTKAGNEELVGSALLVGDPDEDGNETDCLWSIDEVRKFVFFDVPSLRRFVHDSSQGSQGSQAGIR